jgi:hypothetical protein
VNALTHEQDLVAIAVATDPRVVLAAWGATARRETTRLSDMDILCWNPQRVALPEMNVRQAAYLDLVHCETDRAGLRAWALANSTDLNAVMFARVIRATGPSAAQFAEIVESLWCDDAVRARSVYHILAASINVARLHVQCRYRPEKFALGASRCNLRRMARARLVPSSAPDAFLWSMRLRRQCEDGVACFAELAQEYAALGEAFLACAADLITACLPWLQAHAPLTPGTLARVGSDLFGASCWPVSDGLARATGEAEAMMRVFMAHDDQQVRHELSTSPHGSSWWIRYAAVVAAATGAATLRSIVDAVIRHSDWWTDRNLILYAMRHPAADADLLDRIREIRHQLRPIDLIALSELSRYAAREWTRL